MGLASDAVIRDYASNDHAGLGPLSSFTFLRTKVGSRLSTTTDGRIECPGVRVWL